MDELGKSEVPRPLPSNPGKGYTGSVAFARSEKSWTERFDLVSLLASTLSQKGHGVRSEQSWLVDKDSGFILIPQFVELQPLDKGGVRTTTTIQAHHKALVPDGIFEYQHSTGDHIQESFHEGFEQWASSDFVALTDALQLRPKICTTLAFEFPPGDGMPAYFRRAVLGPVTHVIQNPNAQGEQKALEAKGNNREEDCGEHEFCPCCLLTNSFEAFRELIESRSVHGIRLFAMRDSNGDPQADCRVNGNDWDKGAHALRKYVELWPAAGFEIRKQYVVLHSVT